MIEIQPIAAFNDNYIWCLIDRQQNLAVVVDPGDANAASHFLQQQQLELTAILITHHHDDHTGGVKQLVQDRPVPVIGPDNPHIEEVNHPVGDNQTVKLLGLTLLVLSTPGHTLDHISYYCAELKAIFSGDTLFAGGCGRLFEGTAASMLASMDKLTALPDDTRVYCAHEYTLSNLMFAQQVEPTNQPLKERITHCQQLRNNGFPTLPSTLATEKLTNPFLRVRTAGVIASARDHGCPDTGSTDQVFAAIRQWKDQF